MAISSSSKQLPQQQRLLQAPFSSPIVPSKRPQQAQWMPTQWTRSQMFCTITLAVLAVGAIHYTLQPFLQKPGVRHSNKQAVSAVPLHCRQHSKADKQQLHNSQQGANRVHQQEAESTIWRRPWFVFLGDSLTEMGQSADGGWVTRVAAAYNRKADVLNRGFGGYNTYSTLLSLCELTDSFHRHQVLLVAVWLGANDAALKDGHDRAVHVPLKAYIVNLMEITRQLQAADVHEVVLFTPPPVWEDAPKARDPSEIGLYWQHDAPVLQIASKQC
eukprot:GHRR01020268.1.p1 GENE.GHRR01020268.1~~GHRR01020268.1.p1  ORF type:complete len:273 (+),score=88.15 GHRR01020268.1:378-1196(+)